MATRSDNQPHRGSDDSGEPARGALDWPLETGRVSEFMTAIAVRKRRRRHRRFHGAVALLAILGIAGFAWQASLPERPAAPVAESAPAIPAAFAALFSRQILVDGSVVELKEGAEIAVEFTEGFRRVILRRGDAHFEVVKNSQRPFIVDVGGLEVRAIGTAFAVQHHSRAVEVFVTEGRVAVEEKAAAIASAGAASSDAATASVNVDSAGEGAAAGPRTLAVLDAGKGVLVEVAATAERLRVASARMFDVSISEIDQRLAWRAPRLDLSSTPLAQAISIINRHSSTQLVLGDEELGRLELSGVLRADNVEPLLRMLDHNYGIQAQPAGGKIILRKTR